MFDLFSPPSKFPYDDASEWIVGGGSPSHSYANVIRGVYNPNASIRNVGGRQLTAADTVLYDHALSTDVDGIVRSNKYRLVRKEIRPRHMHYICPNRTITPTKMPYTESVSSTEY